MTYSILYLEDDKVLRNAFANNYNMKGYEVHAVETIEEAILALKTKNFHIIISDQKLSADRQGWEFLRQSLAISPHSVRIILSGYDEFDMVINSFKEGLISDYLKKTASNEEIAVAIEKACFLWTTLNGKDLAIQSRDELMLQLIHLQKENNSLREECKRLMASLVQNA